MDSEITNAIDNYYRLKQKYDLSIDRKKQKIISNTSLSIKAKQQKIKEMKKNCVNCGNIGGTIFTNTENALIAVCDCNPACNFNINIKRGYFVNIRTECNNLYEKINEIQSSIISTKLDVLFSYKSEDDAIKKFKKLRRDLSGATKLYHTVLREYLDIVTRGPHVKRIEEQKTNLFIAVEQLDEISKTYDRLDKSVESGESLLKEMVEKYINEILPIVTEIRELTYTLSKVEITDEEIELVQKPYTIAELYIAGIEKPQITTNTSS